MKKDSGPPYTGLVCAGCGQPTPPPLPGTGGRIQCGITGHWENIVTAESLAGQLAQGKLPGMAVLDPRQIARDLTSTMDALRREDEAAAALEKDPRKKAKLLRSAARLARGVADGHAFEARAQGIIKDRRRS